MNHESPLQMENRSISVVVVEDNDSLRDSLSQLIGGSTGYDCLGAFSNCEAFLRHLNELQPDVVLMDIGLPGISGIEGVEAAKALRPTTEILMLTVFDDGAKIFDSLCAGASGYLLKKTEPAKILEAIKEIHEGGSPMTATIARKVLSSFQSATPSLPIRVQLSERERQVMAGLVKGLSYKMIADQCAISIDTVRSHIRHIYDKLHVNSKVQAIHLALRNRLV
jgi:DNA-binding NarL/FixJ family response regulator